MLQRWGYDPRCPLFGHSEFCFCFRYVAACTTREREVLRLAALGVPVVEIAANLSLSTGTVRTYLSTVVRKTRARCLVEAVGIATRAGWL